MGTQLFWKNKQRVHRHWQIVREKSMGCYGQSFQRQFGQKKETMNMDHSPCGYILIIFSARYCISFYCYRFFPFSKKLDIINLQRVYSNDNVLNYVKCNIERHISCVCPQVLLYLSIA